MPIETHLNMPFATVIDLPPGFRGVRLREAGDAFSYAKANAAELGAGGLVFVSRFDLTEFAVVLEPDEPLCSARRAFYAGIAALMDALMAHAPPEKAILWAWPDAIYIDKGLVGGAQLAWSDGPEDAAPHWLVFGGMIRTVPQGEPKLRLLSTATEDEGFERVSAAELIGSFARHLMLLIDTWHELGFDQIATTCLKRLAPAEAAIRRIDGNGDLLVRCSDNSVIERRPLVAALVKTSWLDPATRSPK
jgi:hypothetical protein